MDIERDVHPVVLPDYSPYDGGRVWGGLAAPFSPMRGAGHELPTAAMN